MTEGAIEIEITKGVDNVIEGFVKTEVTEGVFETEIAKGNVDESDKNIEKSDDNDMPTASIFRKMKGKVTTSFQQE